MSYIPDYQFLNLFFFILTFFKMCKFLWVDFKIVTIIVIFKFNWNESIKKNWKEFTPQKNGRNLSFFFFLFFFLFNLK